MSDLVTRRNLDDPDAAYELLIAAHEGRSREESEALNARLILVLANHVGDVEVLRQALEAADTADPAGGDP